MKSIIARTIFISLLLLAVAGTAKAQSNPKKEHTWEKLPMENTAWVHYYGTLYIDTAYLQLGIKGDTVVNGTLYSKMIECTHFGFPIEGRCFGGIRQDDDGQVFFIAFETWVTIEEIDLEVQKDEEYLIYDFSLNVCDTFPYNIDGNEYVFETDEIVINGSGRKVLWFDVQDCEQGVHHYNDKWIEGIGSNYGLLFTLQILYTNGGRFRLVEILQDGEKVYTAPEFVGVDYTAVPELGLSDKKACFYPNPMSESGTLDFGQLNADELTIMTVDGRIVRKENVKGMSSFNIEKKDLESGLYFYVLSGENMKTVVGKMCIK